MQTEDVTVCLLQTGKDFLKVSDTLLRTVSIITDTCSPITPTAIIEKLARRIHDAMKHDVVTVRVNNPLAVDMK